MNFPLKAPKESCQIPDAAICLVCAKKIGEVEGFVRLTTGAMLYENSKRDTGGSSPLMDTIFSLWYHGPHPVIGKAEDGRPIISMDNKQFEMDVVEPIKGGQVDIHFCSASCLSTFFSEIVARFQQGVEQIHRANP